MIKSIYLPLSACLLCIVISKNAFAQVARTDSNTQKYAFNNTLTIFYTNLGEQSPLFNGPEYYFYDPLIKGNAYFSDINAFTPGSVYYDGVYYVGVPMLYDLHTDQVVMQLYDHFSNYSLIKERVASFDLMNHHFINIKSDMSGEKAGLKPGFYDQLYPGKTEILARREKSIQTSTSVAENYFSGTTTWYLRKNNIFYSFGNKGALLNLLKDRKKELRQYINTNQIEFRDNPEEAMVKIVSFYDHLTN